MFHNKGFLFLAVVSCILCVSSQVNTGNSSGGYIEPNSSFFINTGKQMKSTILNQLNQFEQEQSLHTSNVGDYQLSEEEIHKL